MGKNKGQNNNAKSGEPQKILRWWELGGAGLLHVIFFVLAFPPYDWWFLIYFALVPLVWVALRSSGKQNNPPSRSGTRRIFLMMWLAGTTAYLWIQFWITDVALPGYPFLCLYLGIYPALFVWLVSRIRRGVGDGVGPIGWLRKLPNVILVPILWTGLEFFRGDVFMGGYAWFLLGHPSINWLTMCQSADLLGAYFTSFLVATVAGLAGDFLMAGDNGRCGWRWDSVKSIRFARVGGVPQGWLLASAAFFCLLNSWNWFYGVSTFAEESTARATEITVAVIQSNVPQNNKLHWTNQQQFADFQEMVKLTLAAGTWAEAQGLTVDLYAWPETMVPGHAFTEQARTEIQRFEAETGYTTTALAEISGMYYDEILQALALNLDSPLIVGATVLEGFSVSTQTETTTAPGEPPEVWLNYDSDRRYNSALLYRANGTPSSVRYDKIKLTPFGEQMPLIYKWPWLQKQLLALGAQGMTFNLASGTQETQLVIEARTNTGETLRVATPICFESSVAEVCRKLVSGAGSGDGASDGAGAQRGGRAERGGGRGGGRADLLLNLTNDGWFGNSRGGRWQHLQIGRFRCIENRVPMFRAANTGVSAAIDSLGRVVAAGPNVNLEGGTIAATGEAGALVATVLLHGRATVFQRVGQLLGGVLLALTAILGILSFWQGPNNAKISATGDALSE